MAKVLYGTDIYGDDVKLYDYKDTPSCEICNNKFRGGTIDKKGTRKTDLLTDVEKAIKNKQRHSYGHLRKITVDKILMGYMKQPRPSGLKPNQVFACECCYNVHISTIRMLKEKELNTLPGL